MDAFTTGRSLRSLAPASRSARLAVVIIAGLLFLLAGRILTYPLQHDETFYLAPGLLLGSSELYRDIGFTHLPNLPLLLSLLNQLAEPAHVLLVGRLVVIAAWLFLLLLLVRAGRLLGAGTLATALGTALLLFNTDMLGEAGMAATNNFVPFPFAIAGLLLFVSATRDRARAPWAAALAGVLLAVAAGFKANFAPLVVPVGLAALLVPRDWTFRQRLGRLALPLLLGGLVGSIPTLFYLATDPQGFLVRVLEAHRGPQIAYWLAHPNPADPKVITASAKLIFARNLWLGGTALLLLATVGVLLLLLSQQAGSLTQAAREAGWEALLLGSIVALAVILSFLPTPAFPQYYVLPLPFGVLLLLLLHGRLDAEHRSRARPVLLTALLLAVAVGAPSLVAKPLGLVQPDQWASSKLKDDAKRVAAAVQLSGQRGPVATLEPLPVLAGRGSIVPELALGPFLYRAADYMPPAERRHFRLLASPRTLPAVLAARRPSAILVGRSPSLDAPLVAFATAEGYRPLTLPWRSGGEPRERTLFLAPQRPLER